MNALWGRCGMAAPLPLEAKSVPTIIQHFDRLPRRLWTRATICGSARILADRIAVFDRD